MQVYIQSDALSLSTGPKVRSLRLADLLSAQNAARVRQLSGRILLSAGHLIRDERMSFLTCVRSGSPRVRAHLLNNLHEHHISTQLTYYTLPSLRPITEFALILTYLLPQRSHPLLEADSLIRSILQHHCLCPQLQRWIAIFLYNVQMRLHNAAHTS